MGGNLAKAPLVAVFYTSLWWYVSAFLPRSAAFAEAAEQMSTSTVGMLMPLAYGLLAAAIYAVVYAADRKGGVAAVGFLALTALGLQWGVPALRQIMLGEASGIMARSDTLIQLAGGFAVTVVALVLVLLLFRAGEKQPKPGARPVAEPKFKLKKLGLLIRMLVLPLVYFILYYLIWYFLTWQRVEAVREYYGAEELKNFMGEFIGILINRGGEAAITLLVGFAYALFCLPLLLRLKGKRGIYMVSVCLFFLSGAVLYLIPNPMMTSTVRYALMLEHAAVMLPYGALTGFLLHGVFKKEEVAVAAPARPARQSQRPAGGQASPAQRIAAAQGQAPNPATAGK